MFTQPIGRFRFIGIIEGISYLVLLCIAMPLKYLADLPLAVTIAGSLHGLFFILYIFALIHVTMDRRWSIKRVCVAFLAAIIPIGNFVFDAQLKKEQKDTVSPAS